MADKTIKSRVQVKRGTSTDWAAAEATFKPLEGEIIFYSDLNKIKIGKKDANGNLVLLKDLSFVHVDKSDIDNFAHTHDDRYYTEAETNSLLANKVNTSDFKEANLGWGGRNFEGEYGPIDAAMIPDLGANRLAFFPSSKVTLEYSTDSGSTWTALSSDTIKKGLFSTGTTFYIGNDSAVKKLKTSYMNRITLTTTDACYTTLNKFAVYVSTGGSSGCYCTIEARTKANQDAGNNTWTTVANKIPVSGWSGWNIINTSYVTTHGNRTDQHSQIRFTFGVTSHAASVAYAGLSVQRIMAFGGVGWATPSNMARNGDMYTYDADQNVTFPAKVGATNLKISGTVTKAIGGIAKDKTYTNAELSDVLSDLLFPYVAPTMSSITLSAAAGTFEYGTTKTVSKVTPNFTKGSKNITSVKIGTTSGGADLYSGTSATSGTAITLTTNKTFNGSTGGTIYCTISDGTTPVTKSASISYAYYDYSKLTTSTSPDTSGATKQSSSGADNTYNYTAGQYLWLYSRSANKKIQTYVAGSWADVTTTASAAITLTLSSGATATYYAYRTDKFTATGSARYRLA